MKIGFASADWSLSMRDPFGNPVMGGSGHIRLGQFIRVLSESGYDCVLGGLAFDNRAKTFGVASFHNKTHFDCDVMVLQRFMHMDVLPDMRSAQASGQVVLNDLDDWYWGLSEKNAAHRLSDPSKNVKENINWYKDILIASDGVLTSTPFLFNQVKRWNENVVLQTNYVNTNQFSKVKPFEPRNATKFTVGWMGSTAHRSGDLEILRPVANQISQFATWHHTGDIVAPNHPRFYKEVGVSSGAVSTSPFLPPYELQNGMLFNAGIVPLTNIPFNHAKSYIKGLEYAASGIPFVASWSPQYEELVEEHGIGFLAKSEKDYVKLLKVFSDGDYRVEKGLEFKQKAKKFDVTIGAERLAENIATLVKEARREKR
jgi:hypothetical protein